MSANIHDIFVAAPASSMVSTDLLYLGRSPYGITNDMAITYANFSSALVGAPIDWHTSISPTFTTPGDLAFSYHLYSGLYVKNGNLVTASFLVDFTPTYTTASGSLIINGLPFAANAGDFFCSITIDKQTGTLTFPGTTTVGMAKVQAGNTYLEIFGTGSGQPSLPFTTTEIASGTFYQIRGTISYISS